MIIPSNNAILRIFKISIIILLKAIHNNSKSYRNHSRKFEEQGK